MFSENLLNFGKVLHTNIFFGGDVKYKINIFMICRGIRINTGV